MHGMALLLAWLAAACAQPQRVGFTPFDPTFKPSAGSVPRAYTSANISELRGISLRSLGIIEVRTRGHSEAKAAAIAANTGQQLGCWAVVEHESLRRLQSRLVDGATVDLAHGGLPHTDSASPRERTFRFDCVVLGMDTRAV